MENENRNINTIKSIYGEFHRVFLTPEEYHKLITKLGVQNTNVLIADLDRYIESKGKDKYKSHYATIQAWATRRGNEFVEKKLLQVKTRTIA